MITDDIWTSLARLSQEIADSTGLPNIEIIDWETYGEVSELPETDLIGSDGLQIMEGEKDMLNIVFSIGVSTYGDSDQNLYRLRKMVSHTFDRLRVLNQVVIVDNETGTPYTKMIITDGTMMAPMAKAEARGLQFVQASALLEPLKRI